MRLAATRSSINAGSAGPADAGSARARLAVPSSMPADRTVHYARNARRAARRSEGNAASSEVSLRKMGLKQLLDYVIAPSDARDCLVSLNERVAMLKRRKLHEAERGLARQVGLLPSPV